MAERSLPRPQGRAIVRPMRRMLMTGGVAAVCAGAVLAPLSSTPTGSPTAYHPVALVASMTGKHSDPCYLGYLPGAGGIPVCADPPGTKAVAKRVGKCVKGATIGGLGGLTGGGIRGALRAGAKLAGRAAADVGLEGLAGGCVVGQFE